MILKVCQELKNDNAFFDDFNYVDYAIINEEIARKENYDCPLACFFDENFPKVLRIQLMNKRNELLRVVYAAKSYSVYLLNDEGKTIERLN